MLIIEGSLYSFQKVLPIMSASFYLFNKIYNFYWWLKLLQSRKLLKNTFALHLFTWIAIRLISNYTFVIIIKVMMLCIHKISINKKVSLSEYHAIQLSQLNLINFPGEITNFYFGHPFVLHIRHQFNNYHQHNYYIILHYIKLNWIIIYYVMLSYVTLRCVTLS